MHCKQPLPPCLLAFIVHRIVDPSAFLRVETCALKLHAWHSDIETDANMQCLTLARPAFGPSTMGKQVLLWLTRRAVIAVYISDAFFALGDADSKDAVMQYLDLRKGDSGLTLGDVVKEVLEGGRALLHIPLNHDQPPHHPLPLHLYFAAGHASRSSHVQNDHHFQSIVSQSVSQPGSHFLSHSASGLFGQSFSWSVGECCHPDRYKLMCWYRPT